MELAGNLTADLALLIFGSSLQNPGTASTIATTIANPAVDGFICVNELVAVLVLPEQGAGMT